MTIKKWLTLTALCIISAGTLAQTLVHNVTGYTMDNDGKLVTFSSLLIDDGRVIALNPDKNTTATTTIDGKGRIMLPGLIDAHGHLLGLGANLLEVNLREAQSARAAADEVAAYALGHRDQPWVIGRGWNQELWPDRAFPTAATLDEKVSDRPVWLTRVDGHAGWANTKALEIAGITADTPDPTGGQILRDADGNPTGVLIDNATALVERHIPQESSAQLKARLDAAGQHLLANGITAMHDAGISHAVYDFYMAQTLTGDMPIRVYAMLSATDPTLDAMLDNGIIRSNDDFLYIRSVKAYGDGALGSRGAALLAPYSDAPSQHGLLLTQPEDMDALFTNVLSQGFQLNYHAIGDKANRLALDAFERAFKHTDGQSLRNRIEHAQVIAPDDLMRFSSLKVLPSMQPTHATSDMNMAEDRLGSRRIKGAYAWKTLLESGIPLPLGSDFPVELANPFYGLHAAVTRQDRNNQPVEGWYPHEALTIEQAFKGFTLDAAYAAHMEDSLGGLTPGKWADFIMVDRDIFTIPAQDLWKTRVLATYVAGNKVFEAR
ncbi:amidohydrolase [Alteromonas sp. CYL-A6]|uniref:amidohydrolase n=1 Tax=Alteromonas nitratireducens TaxID=3390813 RepID=UPI0034C39BCD